MRGVMALVLLWLAGCGEARPDASAQPEPPPLARYSNDELGLDVRAPEHDFVLLEGAEAADAFGADAVVGLRQPPRCDGWVSVTSNAADYPAIRAAAHAARDAIDWDERRVVVDEKVLYGAAATAHRVEVQGRRGDAAVGQRMTFVAEYGRLFAIHARSTARDFTDRRRCLDAITGAVDIAHEY